MQRAVAPVACGSTTRSGQFESVECSDSINVAFFVGFS